MDQQSEADYIVDELDFSSPRTVGRAAKALVAEYAGDLAAADLAALATDRGIRPAPLKRLHSSHHALARCLASGMKPTQASLVTGHSYDRIASLKMDPAFMALVAEYGEEFAEGTKGQVADLAERMMGITADALEILHDRLQDAPDEFTTAMLLETSKTFLDRTGHGPRATSVNVNVNTTAAQLEAGRRRAGLTLVSSTPKTIEHEETAPTRPKGEEPLA